MEPEQPYIETASFPEIRSLWSVVNDIFGVENAQPVRRANGSNADDSDGPEGPADAPSPQAADEVEEPSGPKLPKEDTVRALQLLSGGLLDSLNDLEALAHFRQLDDASLIGDEEVHCLLKVLGYAPPDTDIHMNPWTFAGARRPLLSAAKHFFDTKLGMGHPNDCSNYSAIAMAMMAVGDMSEAPLSPDPEVDLDLDRLIQQVRYNGEAPTADEIKTLCYRARKLLEEEDNIVCVDPPCTVVGDIHGQFDDLVSQVLVRGGEPGETRYVFLGDFVDRGENSLLCMALILLYKIKFPKHVVILRGNHESRVTNTMYGFHEECRQKYPMAMSNFSTLYAGKPDSEIWTLFNHLFDALPLAALIGGKAFGCHGGLSPDLQSLDRLLTFNRFQDIMPQGPMADLTWSDPGPQEGWRVNVRGSGHAFGQDITTNFCLQNGLDFVCRAHQCVKQGYKWDQNDRIVTIFSAPNYCYAQNKGAIMKLDANMNSSFISYDQADRREKSEVPMPGYFRGATDDDDDDDDDDGPQQAGIPFGRPDFSADPSAPTDANRLEADSSTDSFSERSEDKSSENSQSATATTNSSAQEASPEPAKPEEGSA
eukprot:TRINITY_DN1620_c3_g1_i1.p1 TRINITY_DN1620_c3_g1~~TRINITY_DN1620_c3_g1_i1.p1  ORF type:complete len:596 (+),score=164.61 TRINITY_DN1620_c3_g1_i1:295-2082(+)